MTIYYVGPGGSDASNGLSWANRKLTLNGAEDVPVVAGDTVYVGPGVYRELLTVDVAGSSGSPITYIADTLGENTDGIGGVVRITGSNNDQSATRGNCITLPNARSFRTFRGFFLDTSTSSHIIVNASSSDLIFEDLTFQPATSAAAGIQVNGTGTGNTIRRCTFMVNGPAIQFIHTTTVSNAGHLVENILVTGNVAALSVRVDRVGGITVKNSTFFASSNAVRILTALAVGQTVNVNNCILMLCATALVATTSGEITEDYNTFFANNADRSNVSTGTNSVTYPPIFEPQLLRTDYRLPWKPFNPSEWSQIAHRAGTGEASDDIYGLDRAVTSSKKSWGAVQDVTTLRATGTVRTGTASINLPDAGRHQMFVPVTNTSTTISIYVQREADYAGTNPQMVIHQPGQSDRTTTDASAASQWNELTDTFTPASTTDFVIVELVSNNTATSGNYDVFFDDLSVS